MSPTVRPHHIDVYSYTDHRLLLRDLHAERKRRGEPLSHRRIARGLGRSSPATFRHIVAGRNRLADATVPALARLFGLQASEAAYLRLLTRFNQASTLAEKQSTFRRMHRLMLGVVSRVPTSRHGIYADWYTTAIWAMLAYYRHDGDHARLGRALLPPIGAAQARSAVARLVRSGMLRPDSQGLLRPSPRLITTGKTSSVAVKRYQAQTMHLAARAIDGLPPDTREIATLTVALSPRTLSLARSGLAECRRRILGLAARDRNCDRVYQVNTQVFPLALPGGRGVA